MQPKNPDGSENYYHPLELIPTVPGGMLVIADMESGGKTHRLNMAALERAWNLLQEKEPRRWGNIMSEDFDAEDGDVFLQLALFGSVIYG